MQIKSRKHIIEVIARAPELLEPGLKHLDSNIVTLSEDSLDILAIDSNERLVLINADNKHQEVLAKDPFHILALGLASWERVVDSKDDYFDSVKHLTGSSPAHIPPRLFIVAPSFDPKILSLAKFCHERIDIQLFTFNADKFEGKQPFANTKLDDARKASKPQVKKFYDLVEAKMEHGRINYSIILSRGADPGYKASKLEDHFKDLNKQQVSEAKTFINGAAKLNILARPKQDKVHFIDEYGELRAYLALLKGDARIDVIISEHETRRFTLQDADKALQLIIKG